jgi:hypothetical protein
VRIVGIDFTSAPSRKKPIVVAVATKDSANLVLEDFLEFSDWPAYDLWLSEPNTWVGGFDFPFGLPRNFVLSQGWPVQWVQMVEACVRGGKNRFAEIAMAAFKGAKVDSDKHRVTDLVAKSHSPLKTKTNPPVGLMFYEGASRIAAHRLHVPGLRETGSEKVALEAFPGLLVSQLGERYYKNDTTRSAVKNANARERIVAKLLSGCSPTATALKLGRRRLRDPLFDPSGDWLDAVICAIQAAWASGRPHYGVPEDVPSCEGWIVSATLDQSRRR